MTRARSCFVIPSYNAGKLLAQVVEELFREARNAGLSQSDLRVLVVDDGSTDGSTEGLPDGVTLLRHETNRGKGAALLTGFARAKQEGFVSVVTLDADLQHPPREALRLAAHPAPQTALLLAVRDLGKAGAPRPNQLSNRFSNWVLSMMAGIELEDTQCGLRRYPLDFTQEAGSPERGYAFEADLVLRAARSKIAIVHVPSEVRYPKGALRVSHFDAVKDPARIVLAVVRTALFYVPEERPVTLPS